MNQTSSSSPNVSSARQDADRMIYCTLFDKSYLLFGLTLHQSLLKQAGDFHLYILAMDEICGDTLAALSLKHVTVIPLGNVIDKNHEFMLQQMNFGQLCWSCQPLLCRHIVEKYNVHSVTYLESDSYFFSSPNILFDEIADRSVSLVPHNYSVGCDQTRTSGEFCVQFNFFRNDLHGRKFLDDWEASCMQYDRSAPTYFPGQLCLDAWPRQSDRVCVIHHPGAGVAPWNQAQFSVSLMNGLPLVDGQPVVFYHFHELSLLKLNTFFLSSYHLENEVIDFLYRPYLVELMRMRKRLWTAVPGYSHFKVLKSPGLMKSLLTLNQMKIRESIGYLLRIYHGRNNILELTCDSSD